MTLNELDPIEIIRAEARAVAQSFGVPTPDEAAASMVERVQARLAGVCVYIPSRSARERQRVRDAIHARWTGDNAKALAREFGLTPRGVRKIVAGGRTKGAERI